ncbi:MAG TPA: hypothetical protein VK753_09540 [Xanthomonadaceae bacterium]|nr:hypothetical protein [Xanthomonadaceae bacterium]
MATTRIIDCIGASDEDIAHLRLLLRTARIHLRDLWRWGPDSKADLVIVDTRTLIGDDALRRTQQRGVACAQIVEADAPAPDGRHLRKPLRRDDFVALLNGIGEGGIEPLPILTQGDDFFDMDLGESDDEDTVPSVDFSLRRSEFEREHDAFESLFHRDPLAEKPQFLMPEKLEIDTSVEFVRDATVRSESRADAYGNPFLREGLDEMSIDPSFRHDLGALDGENETHPLHDYLQAGLLGGPARITLPGAPPLVLDPKEQVFHAEGRLPALAAYLNQPLRLGDWERLVSSELVALRLRVPARPYLRLVWMDRFIHSNGYLSQHLDPAGNYRLKRWLELAQDYPRAFRVGANMLVSQRLHEIARVSEVSLAEVFDVVNAYEAIGYVEWTRRERTQRPDP